METAATTGVGDTSVAVRYVYEGIVLFYFILFGGVITLIFFNDFFN